MSRCSGSTLPRVLSIQSTVSHGYVGNKAATFPLQCMGFNVDGINTVSLSNHPNYSNGFKGQFLSADELRSTVEGLNDNNLLNHDIVMNGYTRNIDVLLAIKETVAKVQSNNPNAIYVCDPVLGDNDQFYVPEELLDVYKTQLIPIAHVITPNYFEVEVLTGMKVNTTDDARKAANLLHDMGAKIVVMTGQRLQKNSTTDNIAIQTTRIESVDADTTAAAVSSAGHESPPPQSIILSIRLKNEISNTLHRIDVPTQPGYFFGCGDLFAALTACGIYRAINIAGNNLNNIENSSNADNTPSINRIKLHHLLGPVLELSAWAIGKVVQSTFDNNMNELRIVENIDCYLKIHSDWTELMNKMEEDSSVATTAITTTATTTTTTRQLKSAEAMRTLFDIHNTIYNTISPSYCLYNGMFHRSTLSIGNGQLNTVKGIIVDMDGTLTQPGLIDFDAMFTRNGLSRENGSDILEQINNIENAAEKNNALSIIEDEEIKAMINCELRNELYDFISVVKNYRIRLGLSTRNSEAGLSHFMKYTGLPNHTFVPALHRDSLNGINKPDPSIVHHIYKIWGEDIYKSKASATDVTTHDNADGDVWFLGDSVDDMKCGYDAGCKTCLIRTKFNTNVEKENSKYVTVAVDSLVDWTKFVGLH